MKDKILKNSSVKVKMTLMLIVIMASTILLSVILNIFLLEPYYVSKEKTSIIETYEKVNRLKKEENLDTSTLDNVTRTKNYRMVLADSEGTITYSSERQKGMLYNMMIEAMESLVNRSQTDISENGYSVITGNNKTRTGTNITLIGYLDTGEIIIIMTPMESIKTSAYLSSRFTAYIGMVLLIIGGIAMYIYSKKFTRPIEEMAKVADRMTDLDFDAKVENCNDDEIGTLGKSLNQLSRQLEGTISELKAANIELQKDIEKKEEIDAMRTEFLSHVSHELKTPIALIQGYAEGLKDGISDDDESKDFYCDVIGDEARKMNKMVQKLLTLNQIEFGNNQINLERFDICELIQNMLSSNQIFFMKEEVSVTFDEQETYVWADEFMIEEVFGNYLSNARNHVNHGGRISIYFTREEDNLRVHVFNTGAHIPEEDIDKLWTKFYKVDKARTREYGGSGIGLSIVAATMNAHGKAYGVANVEGGVEFYFDLDCKKEDFISL